MESILVVVVLLFVVFMLLQYLKEEKQKGEDSTSQQTNGKNKTQKSIKKDEPEVSDLSGVEKEELESKDEEMNFNSEELEGSAFQPIIDEVGKCYDLARFGKLEKKEFVKRVLDIFNKQKN